MNNLLLKEYIQHLVKEALDEGKFEDAVKANPKLAIYLEKYFKGIRSKYIQWVVNSIKKFIKKYHRSPTDEEYEDFRESIEEYDFLVSRNRLKEKDINRIKDWDALENINREKVISQTELRKIAKANSKKLFEDETYLIVQPLTEEASIYYGKGTMWCISGLEDNSWDSYSSDDQFLFLINKKTGDKDALQLDIKTHQIIDIYTADDEQVGMSEDLKTYISNKYPKYIIEILENRTKDF